MGFLTRLLIPRSVRRGAHPTRVVKSACTPKSIKSARRALHPGSAATYAVTRSLNTTRPSRAPHYRHGTCTVRHRTPEAAARCKRTY